MTETPKTLSTNRIDNLFSICEITMVTAQNEQLSIRIDRGRRPAVNVSQNTNHVQIYIPLDNTVNHQPISQNIGYGYIIKLQRMQQQYKITLQHTLERKPECVVYASSYAHDQEIKTTVRECNSKLQEMTIAGANLEVNGVLKGNNLTFESTVGTMHVYAKITCTNNLNLHSQNIVLSTESLLCTDVFKAICRKMQIDGRIFPYESDGMDKQMHVDFTCSLVHIGVDGCVGTSNENPNKTTRLKPTKNILANSLRLNVIGDLANYGKITAKERIDLSISGTLISLSDGSLDSAGRGYNALKKLRKVGGADSFSPSSSTMHIAIQNQNAGIVANLIENGVDLNDTISKNKSKKQTLRQSAIAEYKEARQRSKQNSVRERITLINALFATHDWRRGTISANCIEAVIGRNCEDAAQLSASQLKMKVGGVTTVEKDSIWNSTWIELDSQSHVVFNGQTKCRSMIIHSGGTVQTTSEAILSFEMFARINSLKFDCNGMWCCGDVIAIDTKGNCELKSGSYIESEKLEIECGNACDLDGILQLTSLWTNTKTMLTVQANAKLFIEDSANVSSVGLHFNGFCQINGNVDLLLQDSAHFSGTSRLEAHVFNITCKGFCTLGGALAVTDLVLYVRNELITTCTARIIVMNNAEVTTGSFKNDALWQVEKNIKMVTGSIEQSEDGTLYVKYSMNVAIHDDSLEYFSGRIVSGDIMLKVLKKCVFDGLIRCNDLQISTPYINESQITIKGQTDIVAGSLTVNSNLQVDEENISDVAPPSIVIDCNLTATAIVAPFASVLVNEKAVVRLSGLKSHYEEDFNILINAGALSTQKESSIVSMNDKLFKTNLIPQGIASSSPVKSEAIICATTFAHKGQVKFCANDVSIITPVYIHEGRLTNVENKQNHVRNLFISIGELLINKGIIASDNLEIFGDGFLENKNRIYAVETMDIKMRNFSNENGLIESKNSMKLLAVSKEWTKVEGSIKAKKTFDLCANRLNVAIRNVQNLSVDKRLTFSAKDDLLISSNVVDESKELSVGCAAQRSVEIDCEMQVDRLEVLVGNEFSKHLTGLFAIHPHAHILANTVIVNTKCEHLHVQLNGALECNRLRFSGAVKYVTIQGAGSLNCGFINLQNCRATFEMYTTMRIDEIHCSSFEVVNDNIIRLDACEGEDTTTIVTEDLNICGNLFLEKKLFVKSREGSIRIGGAIYGATPASEFACEANKIVIKGQLGSLKFAELFARESISIQNEKIRNIEKFCIECADLSIYNADIERFRNISINCDSITSTGCIRGEGRSTLTLHSTNIHSKMDISDMERVSVFCKRSTAIKGKIECVDQVDVDSKWLNLACEMDKVDNVKLTGWAISNSNQICAENITVSALSVIVNTSSILANKSCNIAASFILSPTVYSTISSKSININSLCLCTRNNIHNVQGVNYMWLCFDPLTKKMGATNNEINSFKATFSLLRDRWITTSLDADEILIGLKYISDLHPAKFELNTDNSVCESLLELCTRYESTPVSLFHFGEFITILHSTTSLLTVLPDTNRGGKKAGKKRLCGTLYESLLQFKHGKYSKDCNESSDTDIGYVSRSSSEDLNSKSQPRSPVAFDGEEPSTSFFAAEHLHEIDEKVEKAEVDIENDISMEHINYTRKEEEELAEFEELEVELEMEEEGIIRTDYITCRDRNIYLAKLKEKIRQVTAPRPKMNLPIQRVPSSNDLVMKKLKVKNAISSFDLRSFGSQSSLASIDFGTVPDFGSPLQFSESSPFQRSKIPLGSFRSPKKNLSRAGTPTSMTSSMYK